MKKILRVLAALLLAFLMAAGDLTAAAAPAPVSGVRAEILAKSRKKKNMSKKPCIKKTKARRIQ